MDLRTRLGDARLYLLATAALSPRPLVETVRRAVRGGVDVVQLREKELGDAEFAALAAEIGEAARQEGAIFLLNDRVRVATELPCDGVHLGQDDLPLPEARRLLGPEALIGLSTHSRRQAREGAGLGADYVGVGPVFATATKETGYSPLGAGLAAAIARASPVPAFAIGGVTLDHLPALVAAGVRRVAVSSAICGAGDPEEAAARMKRLLTGPAGGTAR